MPKGAVKKIRDKPAKWTYCFKSKKFEMHETKEGIVYSVSLDSKQFYAMMDVCDDSFDREQWLIKNKNQPKPTKNASINKRLV
jgi:hypothetical protein